MDEKSPREYQFLDEKTKDLPKNWKKFGRKIGMTVIIAAVFGAVACLVFFLLKPAFERMTANSQSQTVQDDETDISALEEEASAPEQIIIEETPEMTLEQYETLQTQLYSIGRKASRSVVSITGVANQKDWFEDDVEVEGNGSGIIIEETDSEILILTEKDLIQDASRIDVTFYGNGSASAYLKAYDSATGIAVLGVDKNDVSDTTKSLIQVAEMADASTIVQGSFVIGIGSPLGRASTVVVGSVTSSDEKISVTDANYRIITTDIAVSEGARGALLNSDGEIVGLLYGNEDSDMLQAILISEISDLIERLADGVGTASLGIQISEVTDTIAASYGLPSGVYIKSIEADSPAVTAGLQVGDVIVKIDSTEVTTESAYENALGNIQRDQKITITVKRQGADGEYQEVVCKADITIAK